MESRATKGDQVRTWLYQKVVSELMLWVLFVFSLINTALMAGFLMAGASEGFVALRTFFGHAPSPGEASMSDRTAMELGLKSFELVLMAPLGYVLVSALAHFVVALDVGTRDDWSEAFRAVVGVKALATSLLISIVGANFVGKILEDRPLDLMTSIVETLVFIVLVVYLLVLEHSQNASRKDRERKSGN